MALIAQITKVQGQALDTITEGQQRALEVNDRVAGALKHRVPPVKFPLTGLLPTPTEGVKLYFDFAGKLLANNRSFAERFVGAWDAAPAPVAPKAAASTVTTTKAATTKAASTKATAPKAAARKATARKAPATRRASKAAV